MKAVIYKGEKEIAVEDVERPEIQEPRDAILKVTSTAICGSDLHMYDGRTAMDPGSVVGHEIMGVIDEVGDDVISIAKGDRVVLPFNIACGFCFNCVRGFTSACLTANPESPSAAYGYTGMGPYDGGQAEFVRVLYADFNCLKLPGEPGDEFEDDFLLLSDIFPTGYHATELAHVEPGSTVAIFGAGPVGLLAAHSAFIRGAAQVYVVDRSEQRLKIAKDLGAIPVNFEDGSPVDQIFEARKKNKLIRQSLRPGEEKMKGVMCGIDAVGYQGRSVEDPESEDPAAVLNQLIEVVNATGHIGMVGVYFPEDPGAPNEKAKNGILEIRWGKFFEKGLTLGCGQTPVKKYNAYLRDLIIAGRANPSRIISHRVPIEKAPEAYQHFDARGTGEGSEYTKVVLKPNGR